MYICYNKNDWPFFIVRANVIFVNKEALRSTHTSSGGPAARCEEEGEGEDTSRSGRGRAPCTPKEAARRSGNHAKDEYGSQRGSTQPDSRCRCALFCPARLL